MESDCLCGARVMVSGEMIRYESYLFAHVLLSIPGNVCARSIEVNIYVQGWI